MEVLRSFPDIQSTDNQNVDIRVLVDFRHKDVVSN
jgi:hypothetical protein